MVVSHDRPDGDALGSMAALVLCASAAGKSATAIVPADAPARYAFLLEGAPAAGPERFGELARQADCIVVADTCALAQLEGLADGLRRFREKVVVIDHHLTRDEVGALQWIDPSAAAAGVMVAELIAQTGWPLGRAAAAALAAAILTDTGWLRFSNTDARALQAVAKLTKAGAKLDELYTRIFQSDRPERLLLKARMLAGLELHCGGRLAVMTIRKADFAETGATQAETEDLVNEAMSLGDVEAAVLVVETDGTVRASLRSKPASPPDRGAPAAMHRGEAPPAAGGPPRVADVSRIAARFGGGGHARAAGCKRQGTVDEFKAAIIEACRQELADAE